MEASLPEADAADPLFILEVSLEDGTHASLPVLPEDTPNALAASFAREHGLSPAATSTVASTISNAILQLNESMESGPVDAAAAELAHDVQFVAEPVAAEGRAGVCD